MQSVMEIPPVVEGVQNGQAVVASGSCCGTGCRLNDRADTAVITALIQDENLRREPEMAVSKSITKRILLLALFLAVPLAQAAPDVQRQNVPQRQSQERSNVQRDDQRYLPRGDEENTDQRQGQRQRISSEERRQMRRDIHDAGRDIYRR